MRERYWAVPITVEEPDADYIETLRKYTAEMLTTLIEKSGHTPIPDTLRIEFLHTEPALRAPGDPHHVLVAYMFEED
jgi:hypothetical protein